MIKINLSLIRLTGLKDGYELRRELFYIVTEITECPFIDLIVLMRYMHSLKLNKWYPRYFLDHLHASLMGVINDQSNCKINHNPDETVKRKLKYVQPILNRVRELYLIKIQ